MARSVNIVGAGAIGIALCLSWTANAENVRQRASYQGAAGRQITVRPRESYLTNGTGASVGSLNAYALDTLKPPQRNSVQGTFVGMRGEDRLPNRFSVPGSDEPLFTFSGP
jgi:hypothetical protein